MTDIVPNAGVIALGKQGENQAVRVTLPNIRGENEEVYTDMVLLSNIVRDGKSWFVLGQKSEQQKAEEYRNRTIEELRQAMTVLLTGKEV